MRKSCFDCVKKHLGSAGIFVKETKLGYPDYDIWVIGELEHASDECLREHKDLAEVIRAHRIKWMNDNNHIIPFEELNKYIKTCQLAAASNIVYPELPHDILIGIQDENGDFLKYGDTRP